MTDLQRNDSGQFESPVETMVAERHLPGDLEAGNPALKATMDGWKKKLEKEFRGADPLLVDPELQVKVEQAQEAAQAAVPASEEASSTTVDKEAHTAALNYAKRLGIPAEAIKSMTPEKLVQAGKVWKEQVDANAELSRELGELRKQAEASKSSKEAASAKAEQPADDLDSVLQPFVAKLDVDEETGKTLGEMLKAVDARWATKVKALESQLGEFAQDRTLRTVQETRDKLKERFPQLGDDAVFETQVLPHVVKLVKGGYTLPEAIDHAARIEFPATAAPQTSQATPSSKRNGVAVTDAGGKRAPAAKDPDSRLRETYYRLCKQEGLI